MIRFILGFLLLWATAAGAQDLRIGLASEPTAMDPHYHNLSPNNSLLSHVFESLVGQDERQRRMIQVSPRSVHVLGLEHRVAVLSQRAHRELTHQHVVFEHEDGLASL